MSTTGTRFYVTVKSATDPDYAHQIDVTDRLGTSQYDRFLDGLDRRVDFEHYWVDTDEADAEHERRQQAKADAR